jgi:hypothetical protein
MRKHILILTLAAFALIAVMGVAGPAAATGPKAWPGYNSRWDASTITGVVERTGNGIAIYSGGGHEYMVSGKDLSKLVGKKVVVTGELSKTGGKDTIAVTKYQTCEYC